MGKKLGSLFSGSGGFELGGLLAGIKPVWNSEIAPFPKLVTYKRLPHVKHYGDVSKLKGGELEAVDIITFGSPCQDLSIAGKRAGIVEGKRSNLFFEAIRIIEEMRIATDGKYPRFAVFENVVGLLSSNSGEDFRLVLESFCKGQDVFIPLPPKKWLGAGEIVGDNFSVAWRVLDAQHFGVAQRRKRIYLIADFNGTSAGEILFESESVSRDTQTSGLPWQRTPASSERSFGAAGFCTEPSAKARSIGYEDEKSPTLRAETVPAALLFDNHAQDARYNKLETASTVVARYGTGGNNTPLIAQPTYAIAKEGWSSGEKANFCFAVNEEVSPTLQASGPHAVVKPEIKAFGVCSKQSNAMMSDNPHSGFYEAETSRTLDQGGGNPTCNQGGMIVLAPYDVRFTSEGTHNARGHCYETDFSRCLDTSEANPDSNHGGIAVVSATVGSFITSSEEKASTLMARDYKDPQIVVRDYIVRRLTPIECARLQGFPDWWCDDLAIAEPTDEEMAFWTEAWKTWTDANGKRPRSGKQIRKWLAAPYSDAEAYKLWGNGIALPCVFFVLSGIAQIQ